VSTHHPMKPRSLALDLGARAHDGA
jgi:hypothetical protein